MSDLVNRYTDGLIPELDPYLMAEELISRRAIRREEIAEEWERLSEQERELVTQADRVLLELAPVVARYWREDMIADLREREKIPESHWWWWLDRIADGDYPQEHLPEAA